MIKKFNQFNESVSVIKTFMYHVSEDEGVYVMPDQSNHLLEQAYSIVFQKAILGFLSSLRDEIVVTGVDVSPESENIRLRLEAITDNVRSSNDYARIQHEFDGWVEIDCTEEEADLIAKFAIHHWEDSKLTYDKIQAKIKKLESEGKTVPDIIKNYKKPSPEHYGYLDRNLEACKKILATRKEKISNFR